MATKKKLLLKVIFDTNVIHTDSSSNLFREDIVNLIKNNASLSDIEIEWYLPELVLHERNFQMNKVGLSLLSSVNKIESLLGHSINITETTIIDHVKLSLNKQIEFNMIKVIKIDTSKIDWNRIIHNSVFRLPPFEDSKKEKGFRDSIILESVKQLIDESPTSKSICRIVFITNDNLLFDAAELEISKCRNIDLLKNIEDLISLINILNSEIKEELINSIIGNAARIFFDRDSKTGLFYSDEIRKKINETFSKELKILHPDADKRENDGSWWITHPGFDKKEKQRIFWKSIIDIPFINYKTVVEDQSNYLFPISGKPHPLSKSIFETLNPQSSSQRLSQLPITKQEKVNDGKAKFEIIWSITLTKTKKLINPKVEKISFLDTVYNQNNVTK